MKKIATMAFAALISSAACADTGDNNDNFPPTDNFEEGLATRYLNKAIADGMEKLDTASEKKYGRNVTKYASAPQFGGYYMGGYYYTNKEGAHSGDGFKQKNLRFYVKGSLFGDFGYLVQLQVANDKFHLKDYWLEWKRYKGFQIKIGQFIRVFGYENPYNPFEFHDGSYAQITQKLCGQADFIGFDNGGGRDQGIQIQGDLFPVGEDKHHLVHYQAMLSNGQTVNTGDANSQKDISGMIAIQPIKGLSFAVWGWKGNFTCTDAAYKGVTVNRNRYMVSAFYDRNDWTVRSEYAHSTGHKVTDYQSDGTFKGTGEAQGWYVALGVPCTPWLKTWVKYDAYQDDGTTATLRSVYSISPNFQLHKNLWIQPRFAYVYDKSSSSKDNVEASIEFGLRF